MIDLNALALFISVAEKGSFTAAGREAGVPKATVSRHVSKLERDLNATLLHRSTRAVSLTDSGRQLYERASAALFETRGALAEIRGRQARTVGTVRISATAAFGQKVVAPILCELLRMEPDLRIDLQLIDSRVDVIQSGTEIAIRMGQLTDSELKSRKLCMVRRLLCAAPKYLAESGFPDEAGDLARHECIVTSAHLNRWSFADGKEIIVRWRFSAGNALLAREAALGGRGIAVLPLFAVADDLRSGRLVRVLPNDPLPAAEAMALFPNGSVPVEATSFVVNYLANALKGREV